MLTARSEELLEGGGEACREKGSKVTVATGDVSVEDDVKRVVKQGIAHHGKIDVLINNAGIADMQGLAPEHFDSETFNRIISVDLVGAFFMHENASICLRTEQAQSSILDQSSETGEAKNGVIAYSAKGGLRNMTMQLGTEWADRGVRVNAVSPGLL